MNSCGMVCQAHQKVRYIYQLYTSNIHRLQVLTTDPPSGMNLLSVMYRIEWTCICKIHQLYKSHTHELKVLTNDPLHPMYPDHIHQNTCMPKITAKECV